MKKKVCQLIHFWNDSLLKYGRSSFSYLDLVLHDNEFEKISLTSSISHFYPFSFLATRGWTTRGCFASFCKQTGSAQCYECEWIDGKIGLAIAEKSKGMCLLVTHHFYSVKLQLSNKKGLNILEISIFSFLLYELNFHKGHQRTFKLFLKLYTVQNKMNFLGWTKILCFWRFWFSTLFQFQWYIQATCATQGNGLYEGLDWLSNELAKSS